jgi:hypothetical protein
MAGIFDTGIFDTGIFDHPAAGATITGTLAATETQDTAAFSGRLAHVGSLAATEGQDVFLALGSGVSTIYVPPALFIANVGRMMSR